MRHAGPHRRLAHAHPVEFDELDGLSRFGRQLCEELRQVEPAIDGLPLLSGFENHGAVTHLGPGVRPLGRVLVGAGNAGDGHEGAVSGRILATYMHGPALARNPALADLLLSWVVGDLPPLDDTEVDGLRAERLRAVKRSRWRRNR